MKRTLATMVLALLPSAAWAQVSETRSVAPAQLPTVGGADTGLMTPPGHDVAVSISAYDYVEPGDLRISIHGPKAGGEYTGTFTLDRARHWFAQADVRGAIGRAKYDGWCMPWLITPDATSPNGYALDLGPASSCSETGDRDWYAEGRVLVGKDFIGDRWGLSPFAGVGLRHLSNGTTGVAGYRTDDYLYPPVGVTVRTRTAAQGVLSLTAEFDALLRGWQTTRDSALGGGSIDATATAPAFTLDSLTDVSFDQHHGWALRGSARYQVRAGWSLEPYFVHWSVAESPSSPETATFTVNGISAEEPFGAYEPRNTTNEFGVRLGFHF